MNAEPRPNPAPDDAAAHPPGSEPSGPRLYDSFIVRLWHDDGAQTMLRAEVEHVQAGLFLEELHVPMDWIVSAIESCLRVPGTTEGHDDRREDATGGRK